MWIDNERLGGWIPRYRNSIVLIEGDRDKHGWNEDYVFKEYENLGSKGEGSGLDYNGSLHSRLFVNAETYLIQGISQHRIAH